MTALDFCKGILRRSDTAEHLRNIGVTPLFSDDVGKEEIDAELEAAFPRPRDAGRRVGNSIRVEVLNVAALTLAVAIRKGYLAIPEGAAEKLKEDNQANWFNYI